MKAVMANLMPNRGKTGGETAAWACKLIFLVIGVASTVVFIGKLAIPCFAYLLSHSIPSLCKSIVPRYLFIAVNSIIIIVWKLNGVQHHVEDHHENHKSRTSSLDSHDPLPPKLITVDSSPSIHESPSSVAESYPVMDLSDAFEIKNIISNEQAIGSDNNQSSDPWPPPTDKSSEDPLLENDTMDAMWKAIMAGGGETSPDKNQNLEKSDISERSTEATTTATTPTPTPALARASAAPARRFGKSNTFREDVKVASGRKEMRKSETFRESSSWSPAGVAPAATGWRGRDRLVIGQDELFNKVEAFIKMNYDQLRLQRQESEQRYRENMVNAAY